MPAQPTMLQTSFHERCWFYLLFTALLIVTNDASSRSTILELADTWALNLAIHLVDLYLVGDVDPVVRNIPTFLPCSFLYCTI